MKRKSCRSHGERTITEYLQNKKIVFEREKTFNNCLSNKNNNLRFDFYIHNINLLIEFQGRHHYQPVNKSYRAKKITEITKLHDSIKRNFCINNGIGLLTILSSIESICFNSLLDNILNQLGV